MLNWLYGKTPPPKENTPEKEPEIEIPLIAKELILKSFERDFLRRVNYRISMFLNIMEDKSQWDAFASGSILIILSCNEKYTHLISTFNEVATKLNVQYNYSIDHKRYALKSLVSCINIVKNTLDDLIIPMDFFMQAVASSSYIKNDIKLKNINKMIIVMKERIEFLHTMNDIDYWIKKDTSNFQTSFISSPQPFVITS